MQSHIDKFILSKQSAGIAAGTIVFYRRALERYAGQHPSFPPTAETIEQYMACRRAEVKPITANGDWTVLTVFLNWCERRQFLKENPLQQLEKPRKAKTTPKPASRWIVWR